MEFGSYAKSIEVLKGLAAITSSPAGLKILETAIGCLKNAWDEAIEQYELDMAEHESHRHDNFDDDDLVA